MYIMLCVFWKIKIYKSQNHIEKINEEEHRKSENEELRAFEILAFY